MSCDSLVYVLRVVVLRAELVLTVPPNDGMLS